ncbi:MAG: ABC transporter substrate-binding protein [Alphaproteobacteria bacterium]|nr:ABC transporter substrate-binding protein [Alphaproteobacteria bacterium]
MRKTLMISGVILAFAGASALADAGPAADVRAVVQKLGSQTVAAFAANELEERRRLLSEAAPAFDFQEIGRNVLNYAGIKVPDSREPEIIDGIAIYVKRVMATELERIRPEKADIGKVELKGDAEALVALTLAGPQDQLKGDWQLKKSAEGWRVTDILVAGNSLASHLGGKLSRQASGGIEQLDDFLKGERERLKKQMAQR